MCLHNKQENSFSLLLHYLGIKMKEVSPKVPYHTALLEVLGHHQLFAHFPLGLSICLRLAFLLPRLDH